jgi:hypothetical protein
MISAEMVSTQYPSGSDEVTPETVANTTNTNNITTTTNSTPDLKSLIKSSLANNTIKLNENEENDQKMDLDQNECDLKSNNTRKSTANATNGIEDNNENQDLLTTNTTKHTINSVKNINTNTPLNNSTKLNKSFTNEENSDPPAPQPPKLLNGTTNNNNHINGNLNGKCEQSPPLKEDDDELPVKNEAQIVTEMVIRPENVEMIIDDNTNNSS